MRVDAILTADLHIMERCPECREPEEFFAAQERKIEYLCGLQIKYECPIIIAGDVFDRWKSSPELIFKTINQFTKFLYPIIAIPGQHDLPNHNLNEYHRSSLAVLEAAKLVTGVINHGRVTVSSDKFTEDMDFSIKLFPWGVPLTNYKTEWKKLEKKNVPKIAVIHEGIYQEDAPFPGCLWRTAKKLLKNCSGWDLIVSGDNHKTFTEKNRETLLVNPGSFMRIRADQTDHKPCIFLWDSVKNKAVPEYLPIEKNVIKRNHIEIQKQRDDRMTAFIDTLGEEDIISLNYTDNVVHFLESHRISKRVQKIIHQSLNSENWER